MINNYKIVDGHVHTFLSNDIARKIIESFNRTYSIEFENPGTGSIEDVLDNMHQSGVDYTVMANFAPPKIIHSNNDWAIETASKNNGLIALVSFHPEMEGNMPALLEEYIEKGARGIKLHPMAQSFDPCDVRLQELYRYCNKIGIPIVFHCGRVSNARLNEYSDLEKILPIIEDYPGIPVVLTHMVDGNVADVLRMAENYPNVYFDTSIVVTGYPAIARVNEPSWLDDNFVVDIFNKVGAERILFGSDYPWGSPTHDLKRLLKMNLTDLQKRLILGENSLKLFRMC